MKAGDRKKIGRFWHVRVVCPICDEGRWVQESRVKMPNFTGRCKKCYVNIARQETTRFFPPKE